jgi:signal transduction histidine kinase
MNSIIHGFKGKDEGKMSLSVKAEGDRIKMVYSDNGNGIAPEIIDKVFDPFVTTNREGGGTGLGMNILYNIVVQQLKGKVDFKTAVNEGVTFIFDLPMNV